MVTNGENVHINIAKFPIRRSSALVARYNNLCDIYSPPRQPSVNNTSDVHCLINSFVSCSFIGII